MLAGCAHFQPQPISPEKTAAQLESRRLDDAGLEKISRTKSRPRIDKLAENKLGFAGTHAGRVLFSSQPRGRPRAMARRPGGFENGGRAGRIRPCRITPGYDSQIPGNFSPWLVPVTFDLPIETAGKRGKRIAEAEKFPSPRVGILFPPHGKSAAASAPACWTSKSPAARRSAADSNSPRRSRL